MTPVAETPSGELIGVARYIYDENTGEAELAIVVQDEWQNRGLGTILLGHLVAYAAEKGIERFRAHVLGDHRRMLDLLTRTTTVLDRSLESGVVSLLPGPAGRPPLPAAAPVPPPG